ncbi:MAG TPA: MerR family transcriptional regulator, partial [Bacteroidales bacterium]|nr:MerR family transcriptional regulator [Bacteroidales bacterium]
QGQGKLYYTIGEVSRMIGENPSLLRFWEKQFRGISPGRNSKGNRIYTPVQVQRILSIHRLVKEKGYTLAGAREALAQEGDKPGTKEELRMRLLRLKDWLLELRERI